MTEVVVFQNTFQENNSRCKMKDFKKKTYILCSRCNNRWSVLNMDFFFIFFINKNKLPSSNMFFGICFNIILLFQSSSCRSLLAIDSVSDIWFSNKSWWSPFSSTVQNFFVPICCWNLECWLASLSSNEDWLNKIL